MATEAANRQAARMLEALQAANGAPVHRRVLVDLVFQPGDERSASAMWNLERLFKVLRAWGHQVEVVRGRGFRLVGAP